MGWMMRAAVPLPMLLVACASNPPAPVEERSLGGERRLPRAEAKGAQSIGPTHRVVAGDTVYGIAFKNDLDYRDLARWNRIGPPYRIYVGQVLRLTSGERVDPVAEAELAVAIAAETTASPMPSSLPKHAAPAVTTAATKPPPAIPTKSELPPARASPPGAVSAAPADLSPEVARQVPLGQSASTPPIPVPALPPATPVATLASGGIVWRWPAPGKVVGTFVGGDPTRQGIDIAGRAGDPVQAAASGTVVYSGNGLIGYGELVIVKHSPTYLSAYGHNRKRLVKEGDAVKAGQLIAEMGASGAREMLHFEIRKSGKPANPLEFLPAR